MRVKIHIHKILQKYTKGLAVYECEAKDFTDVKKLKLGGPSVERPVCNIRNNILRVWTIGKVTATGVKYIKKPEKISGFFVKQVN